MNDKPILFSDVLLKVTGVILSHQHVFNTLRRDQGGLHAQVSVSAAHKRADQRALHARRGAERACMVCAVLPQPGPE